MMLVLDIALRKAWSCPWAPESLTGYSVAAHVNVSIALTADDRAVELTYVNRVVILATRTRSVGNQVGFVVDEASGQNQKWCLSAIFLSAISQPYEPPTKVCFDF